MYPLIAIISRKAKTETSQIINLFYQDISSSIIKSKGLPIGIDNNYLDYYLDICDGFIFQGGDEIDNNNLLILQKLLKKNIPTLGICLGMQEMAIANGGSLYDITNHIKSDYHEITIKKNSLLYQIIQNNKILVNSRHKSAVARTNLSISSSSRDNVIESIENRNNLFYLGVQWHPENMYDMDDSAKKIFDYFVMICQKYHYQKDNINPK